MLTAVCCGTGCCTTGGMEDCCCGGCMFAFGTLTVTLLGVLLLLLDVC
jgi:hypothetical protein